MTQTNGIEGKELREVIGGFATGVTVVTVTGKDERPKGLTANAVTSLSLEPPLLLVAIDRNVDTYSHLADGDHFAVNILPAGEQGETISNVFAGKGEEKFREVDYRQGSTGAPILEDSFAWLDCHQEAAYDGGDHTIFIGRVVKAWREDKERNPLLFYRGEYRELAPNGGSR